VNEALRRFALSRERWTKRWIVMLVDASLCALTCYAAVILRLGFLPERDTPFGLLVAVSIALALPIFHALGLYREIFSQLGIAAIVNVALACAVYALPFATIFTVVSVFGIPRTLVLIQPILLFVCVTASRVVARYWLIGSQRLIHRPRRRVLIYGAGAAGRQLAGAIRHNPDMSLVGYLDDNRALAGNKLDGQYIFHPRQMRAIVAARRVDEILLAIPSASRERHREIVATSLGAGVRIRTLPGLMDIGSRRIDEGQLRAIDVEDLLGRSSVAPDRTLMEGTVRGRRVLVTGAGGSIGGELCRLTAAMKPEQLLLFDCSEYGLYRIHRELTENGAQGLVPLLGSVSDKARIEAVLEEWRPDTIYHAAAYKHVPLVEANACEGVRSNVLGTSILASAAARAGVRDFVLVSTDKAVRPTSVMGATKRVAEQVLQALDEVASETRFSMVRFGNVLESSGSVVPLFRDQIARGGPVTVTDLRITRYFMTIREAAELVLQAGTMAQGGEVFVLDMGVQVRIADLARNMIELAGLTVRDPLTGKGDIEIVEIGLRPGEKLYEELLIGTGLVRTSHPSIMRSREAHLPLGELTARLARLNRMAEAGSQADVVAALHDLVPEFGAQPPQSAPATRQLAAVSGYGP